MIGNIQKTIENLVGPEICGMFSTSGAKSTFTGMRNQLEVPTSSTLIDVTTQNRRAARKDLAHIFKNDRPNPLLVLSNEFNPMGSKDSRDMVADMRDGTKHRLIRITGDLPTARLFAREIQSA
jgi:hypothetical protein